MFASAEAERLTRVFAGEGRATIEALTELDGELRLPMSDSVTHEVAHVRLGWWREELARLAAGSPLHPLTRRLREGGGAPVEWRRLEALVAAAERALAGLKPRTDAEALADCADSHGSLWAVACQLLAGAALPTAGEYGAALGTAIGLVAGAAPEHRHLAADALARADALADARTPAAARVARALTFAPPARAPHPFVQLWIGWRAARRATLESRE